MVDTRLGIELDGSHATIVEVTGHKATSSKSVTGKTPADALKLALADVKSGSKAPDIRVSLVMSSNSTAREISVTAKALQGYSAFNATVFESQPQAAETNVAAGLFFNPENLVGDALGSALAVVAPTEPVEDAYRALARFPNVEIVPPAFTFVGFDGLHLAIRRTNSDLTFIKDGMPVHHRILPTGGLEVISSALGGGQTGADRLEAFITRSGPPDGIVENELRSYLTSLAKEVARTRDRWLSLGSNIPEVVHPSGTGARIRQLVDHISDEGLKAEANEELIRALAYIPLGGPREEATGAFLAGASYGNGAPAASYPSVVARENALTKLKASRRNKKIAAGLLILAIPLAAYFGPVATGRVALNEANQNREAALSRSQSLSAENLRRINVQDIETNYSTIASLDPRWKSVLTQTFSTAQMSGAEISDISAEVLDGFVNVTATAYAPDPSATYTPLTSWLETLQDPEGEVKAQNVTTSSFSFNAEDQTSSFQVTFSIPVDLVLEERTLGASE